MIRMKSWFSGKSGPWLMMFDGADMIENRKIGECIDIKHFIPDTSSYILSL